MACAPKSLAMRRGQALHALAESLGGKPQVAFTCRTRWIPDDAFSARVKAEITSGTWDLNGPAQVLHMPPTSDANACLARWAWDPKPQTDETVDALSGAVYRVHDSITIESKTMTKPRVSDAQVRLNQDTSTEWLAADVVFVGAAQLAAGAPYNGTRYTYKAPRGTGHKQGLLAHVIVNGALKCVAIADVRTPTAEDKLTAHAWLIVDGCYRTYAEAVKKDEERLESIAKAERERSLEAELKASLERTSHAHAVTAEPAKPEALRVRVGGVYRNASGAVQHITSRQELYGEDEWCFVAESGNCYNERGERLGRNPKERLVEEVK